MLKVTLDIDLLVIMKIINLSFEMGCFPDDLKLAYVSPILKKNDNLDKGNYRLVSVLFNLSKVFERIMCSQIDAFMQDKLSNLLTGFRKTIVHNIASGKCLKVGKICWIKKDMYVLCSWTY